MSGGVSVLIPTYGRTALLAEAVECYRRQDYAGPSELVILNDLRAQTLSCSAPGVRVVNLPERIATQGDKRNVLLDLARYGTVTYWDDDDIYLPHRLSYGMELLQDRPAVSERQEWHLGRGGPLSMTLRGVRPFGAMTLRRDAIRSVGGFPPLERNQVCVMVTKLVHARHLHNLPPCSRPPSTIYRLYASVARAHVTDAPVGGERQYVVERTAAALALGEEPSGEIEIRPQWSHDYEALARRAWLTVTAGAL